MNPSKTTKRRHFSNKKTHRIKRRGGMHKTPTPKQHAEAYAKMRENARKNESAAAHAVLRDKLLSRGVRNAVLTTGSALADRVAGQLFVENPMMPLHRNAPNVARSARPHTSFPALFQADDMFQQAERMCSMVRTLPHAECWTTNQWGQLRKSELVKNTCREARALYERAVALKYLPAYAPLAWMMSSEDPTGSMRLCDECIAECDKRRGAEFTKKAKLDCTAIRAFVDYESMTHLMRQFEDYAPRQKSGLDDEEQTPSLPDPDLDAFQAIMEESIKNKRKYGHAMKWLWLSTRPEEDSSATHAQKKVAKDAGIDFDRCR